METAMTITRDSLMTLEAYAKARNAMRDEVMAQKKLRRIALGEHIQTTIIVVMVALGGLLAFVQEYRSERAVRALGERLVHHATVRRDGATARLDARALVLGDVVELVLGSVVPADVRLIEVDDLEIDESTLTGESRPVAKRVDALPGPCPMPQDQANVAFHGTAVVRGAAAGVVFATGGATELGRTATLLTARRGPTSFEQGIDRFGRFLLQVTLALTAIVCVALGVLHGDWAGSLLFALALAVGIAPELLPVIVTVNLAHGALAMSRRHVLVKRLAAEDPALRVLIDRALRAQARDAEDA